MSSKVGSWSILGRTGFGNQLRISSTVRAFLGAMLFWVYEVHWLLGIIIEKKLTYTDDIH
jgi:hypothetical protein